MGNGMYSGPEGIQTGGLLVVLAAALRFGALLGEPALVEIHVL